MDIQKLHDDLSISAQVQPHDLATIFAMGFKSIICNRPDGEEDFQPLFEAIEAQAEDYGMRAVYVPIAVSGPTPEDTAQFARAYRSLAKPVLAYCRTGGRSKATWAAAQARQDD